MTSTFETRPGHTTAQEVGQPDFLRQTNGTQPADTNWKKSSYRTSA
ncbi:hypothetical protein ACFWNL_22485 [Kitasatospora sp. NPDC058397]